MTGLGSSCGACKFLRRRCTAECVFAPYFCYEQAAAHFSAVHKVFGASNVSKLLLHIPLHCRADAAITISYEALARMHDPIYGCVSHIFALQQQVASLKEEIQIVGNQMASCFGLGMLGSAASSDPYFVTQFPGADLMSFPALQPANECGLNGVDQLQQQQQQPGALAAARSDEIEISETYLDWCMLEKVAEELNQDCFVHLAMNEECRNHPFCGRR